MNSELAVRDAEQLTLEEARTALTGMAESMRALADMVRVTNERIGELEREIRLLTKVTPAQASGINRAIRERAAVLCEDYRAKGAETQVAAAIRKAVKGTCGVSSVRELPRCEYEVAMEQVEIWDDYDVVKAIKRKTGV